MSERTRNTILIIDDSPLTLRSLGEALHGEYEVLLATSGQRGLEIAGNSKPDIILLDVTMPEMNGFEVIRRLKGDDGLASIPVIFLTASSEGDTELRGLQMGAVDFIAKPYNLPVVLARIRTQLALKHRNDLLERIAMYDALTAIPNRRSFDVVMDAEWRRAGRSGMPLSLVLVDIDHFKNYNDHYGHAEGDNCLVRVARLLLGCIHRAGDAVFRYGGEEFAAILSEADLSGAVALAEKMRAAVASSNIHHEASPTASHVTISVGVAAAIPDRETTPEALFAAADKALYHAKEQGRDRVEAGAGE